MRPVLLPLLSSLLFAPVLVVAQTVGLYEGEVEVTSQDALERAAVLPEALAQVIGKLTGDPAVARGGELSGLRAEASRLMQSFRYREDRTPTADGRSRRLVLAARFDSAGVDALLADAGAMVWPGPRPPLLVWLAIDDGRGPRLVASAQSSALAPLSRRAAERGLDTVLPLLDLEDQSLVDVAAVRSLDPGPVALASERYRTPLVLMGRLERAAQTWHGSWQVVDRGEPVASFENSDRDPTRLMAEAADQAAGALAVRYASPLLSGEPGNYTVHLEGLQGAADYARALGYLRSLGVVSQADVAAASDHGLELALRLRTDPAGLARLVGNGDVLEPLADGDGAGAPRFRLKP